MPTSHYEIAGYFHIVDGSLKTSPNRTPPIVFSTETRVFLSPKKL